MKEFPKGIQFKYTWRKYQQIFLDQFSSYISDNHLHIVAPPGSGKTVLGLEIMLRINKPTLIIAPTLAIKNQWVQRFTELFLQIDFVPDYISTDIRNPKFITITTYQGVHAACSGGKERLVEEEEESEVEVTEKKINRSAEQELIKKLTQQKIGTFILDEAHHLKKAWWSSLMDLKEALQPTIVALTATPPYDVSGFEWQKYIQLNGPVDAEISVPELMLEGDLCPHQDFVYFSLPTETEREKIDEIYRKAENFIEETKSNDTLLEAIRQHPVYQNPEKYLDWIYENLSSYTSGLVYLNFRGIDINPIHFKVIGDEQKYVPELNVFWVEELLDFYLFVETSHFKSFDEERTKLENRLRHSGFLDGRYVCFYKNKNLNQILNTSIGKLDGIKKISDFEYSNLGTQLRMVILTDFIRKEFLDGNISLDKIGAIPIFEILRRNNCDGKHIALLTGSCLIIPKSAKFRLDELWSKKNSTSIPLTELSYDSRFLILQQSEFIRQDMIRMITQIFEEGFINILVGTKSLLGEGWDAPKINSLVLASFVSSFVMSNQMRGRAIRIDKENPQKTSNIWHLVSFDEHSETGGHDFEILKRRFKTFVGISNDEHPSIENNFHRLRMSEVVENVSQIENVNAKTFSVAASRDQLSAKWSKALESGTTLIEEIEIPVEFSNTLNEQKMNYVGKSIANFSVVLVSTFSMFWSDFILNLMKHIHTDFFGKSVFIFGLLGFVVYGRKFYIAGKQYIRFRDMAKNIEKIGQVIVETLAHERVIRTPIEQLKVIKSKDSKNNVSCHLEGGNQYEKSQFIITLQEFVSPIDNSRYVLKQSKGSLTKGAKYFAVPEIFGKNKKSAEFFLTTWNFYFGDSELVFTRTLEGRKLLLQLRFQNMLKTNSQIKHVHKWTK